MSDELQFKNAFEALTGHAPMPWQEQLYEQFKNGVFDRPLSLPTGLGKTTVIHIWLLALAAAREKVPRRLVYVVNRRTIVDQATREAEKLRENLYKVPAVMTRLKAMCATELDKPLGISTLRGEFADNGEWCADPARPAIIIGTVDMIGSRLLFSGYGCGFKRRPLHAGFLGQDTLLVHDEAHLEPAFQDLLDTIKKEQCESMCPDFRPLHVMALTATPRKGEDPIKLTPLDHQNDVVLKRINARKELKLHDVDDENKAAQRIAELALEHEDSNQAILIFVRKIDGVKTVCDLLRGQQVQVLTGIMRGLERDQMADPRKQTGCPIFARFLKPPNAGDNEAEQWKITPAPGTVYLICTSAGEVGVDISADHLVCDLTPFDSMAQRFGRVNRYGYGQARIDVVYAADKKANKESNTDYEQARQKTYKLLKQLLQVDDRYDASPKALGKLPEEERLDAFSPRPRTLTATDILFDAWALTTIREKLPGRPSVEPYLHGISGWEPPETHVAWREEVDVLKDVSTQMTQSEFERFAVDLLDDYPVKPHELLRDISSRVFDRLSKLQTDPGTTVWIVEQDDTVTVTTLEVLLGRGKEALYNRTVLLPPSAGGLRGGMFDGAALASPDGVEDVADEWRDENNQKRRVRIWENDPQFEEKSRGMWLVRFIDTKPNAEDVQDDTGEESSPVKRVWHWYELPRSADDDGSKFSKQPIRWQPHTDDVVKNMTGILAKLTLSDDLKEVLLLAARWHDLGKKRIVWQRSIGNPNSTDWHAKWGGNRRRREITTRYRHEFGSMLDIQTEPDFGKLSDEMKDVVLHLIATHHGRARPHFLADEDFDPKPDGLDVKVVASEVPRRYARLQRKYGRWGLAYLESLLRAADWSASANPSEVIP